MITQLCKHCRGTKYVLDYWLEKMLEQNGVHMTEIPEEIFKQISVESLRCCHCNFLLFFRENRLFSHCQACEGTTWLFTEVAEQAGYRWKKVCDTSPQEIRELPCEYFERCPCDTEKKGFKDQEKRKSFKDILRLLEIKIPNLGFTL